MQKAVKSESFGADPQSTDHARRPRCRESVRDGTAMCDDHDHHDACLGTDQTPPSSDSSRLTRRRLLGAMAMGAGAVGLSRLPASANSPEVATLEEPGLALEAADRLPHPVPTTTTTTVPVDPPADGEILFPIIVGPDDDCYVLDNYGDCRGSGCSRTHEGVDMMADPGLPVMSVSAGVITKIYTDRGLTYGAGNGWTIYDEENDVHYRYFHLQDLAPGLEEGSEVELGQIIGSVGETGTTGNGNPTDNFHLHFEWRPNNIARNSFGVLQRTPYVDFQGE